MVIAQTSAARSSLLQQKYAVSFYIALVSHADIVHQEQEEIYNLLLLLQTDLLSKLKDGAAVRGIYQHALSFIKDKKPSLEKNFVKNLGFGVSRYDCRLSSAPADTIPQMGLEFRDSAYLLSPKNSRHLKENMVLNFALGFSDLQDDNGNACVRFRGIESR